MVISVNVSTKYFCCVDLVFIYWYFLAVDVYEYNCVVGCREVIGAAWCSSLSARQEGMQCHWFVA